VCLIGTLQKANYFLKAFRLGGKLGEPCWRIVMDAIKRGWQVKKLNLSLVDAPALNATLKELATSANSRSLCSLVVNYQNIVEFPKVLRDAETYFFFF